MVRPACCLVLAALGGACIESTPLRGEAVVVNGKPRDVLVDGNDVYWLDAAITDDLRLYRASLSELPIDRLDADLLASKVANGSPAGIGLAADATSIYVASIEGIDAIPKAGGAPRPFVVGPAPPLAMQIHNGTLYWVTAGLGETLYWTPLAGGAVSSVTLPDESLDLIVDASNIYVRGYVGVYEVSTTTRTVTRLAAAADFMHLFPGEAAPLHSISLAQHGNRLEWIIHQIGAFQDQDMGALIEIPLTNDAPRALQTDLFGPGFVTVDARGVIYYTESNAAHTQDPDARNGIQRLAPGATTAEPFIEDVSPNTLEASSDYLYWSTPGAEYDFGYVRRVAVP